VRATPPLFNDGARIDFSTRARDLLAHELPRIAQRAERSVLRVLFAAGGSDGAVHEDEIRRAAALMRHPPDERLLRIGVAPGDAQSLNDAARTAPWRRGGTQHAGELQLRAFGANPLDPEIAGNLARVRLREQPQQAASARELALHALTLPDDRHPHGRLEDWTTFAIASALTGRERDAGRAWLVTMALAPSAHRQCRVAADAYALYGERLRPSVEWMLSRLQGSGGTEGSPFCGWPPFWSLNGSRTVLHR
jgi:hypothetical protein